MRSVWSRDGAGLAHGGGAVGVEAGEEERRLDLRRGHRRVVLDAARAAPGAADDRAAGRPRPACCPRCPSTRAPIARSGSATRRIGRALQDWSPTSVVANGCAGEQAGRAGASRCPSCRSRAARRRRAARRAPRRAPAPRAGRAPRCDAERRERGDGAAGCPRRRRARGPRTGRRRARRRAPRGGRSTCRPARSRCPRERRAGHGVQ